MNIINILLGVLYISVIILLLVLFINSSHSNFNKHNKEVIRSADDKNNIKDIITTRIVTVNVDYMTKDELEEHLLSIKESLDENKNTNQDIYIPIRNNSGKIEVLYK